MLKSSLDGDMEDSSKENRGGWGWRGIRGTIESKCEDTPPLLTLISKDALFVLLVIHYCVNEFIPLLSLSAYRDQITHVITNWRTESKKWPSNFAFLSRPLQVSRVYSFLSHGLCVCKPQLAILNAADSFLYIFDNGELNRKLDNQSRGALLVPLLDYEE